MDGQLHSLQEGFKEERRAPVRLFAHRRQSKGDTFMDYLIRTAVKTPNWEIGKTCTPPSHHPFGAKGVGESPNVGSPAAFGNPVVDALAHLGVRDTSKCRLRSGRFGEY